MPRQVVRRGSGVDVSMLVEGGEAWRGGVRSEGKGVLQHDRYENERLRVPCTCTSKAVQLDLGGEVGEQARSKDTSD